MLVYYFVPFIVSNRYLLFCVSNGYNSVTVQNRTHVYMNFFDHKDLGNHLLQLRPKVVKHPVYFHVDITTDNIYQREAERWEKWERQYVWFHDIIWIYEANYKHFRRACLQTDTGRHLFRISVTADNVMCPIIIIQQSAWRQVQSLLQNDPSTYCYPQLPPSNDSTLFCP